MEVWTFPGFEFDSVTSENSFNSSFHLLQASDKFSRSNSSDLNLAYLKDYFFLQPPPKKPQKTLKKQVLQRKKKKDYPHPKSLTVREITHSFL